MSRLTATLLAAGLAGAGLLPEAARADESLPGVDAAAGAPIVTERPDEEAPAAGERPGSFRVGNWDVTVSGSVSFQVGTGTARHGR